jgi:ribonuclease P protein component
MLPPRSGDPCPEGERLSRSSRIHRGGEIRTLLGSGARRRGPNLEVFTAASAGGVPRFGTVVPRFGNSVVERNLLRRRLREIGRTELLPRLRQQGCPADVLVRARPPAYEASFSELGSELSRLTDRLCSDAS